MNFVYRYHWRLEKYENIALSKDREGKNRIKHRDDKLDLIKCFVYNDLTSIIIIWYFFI